MLSILASILNPAGGLRYHLWAARYGPILWCSFRKNIGAWLERWNPPERKLIIIGQSGGYNLTKTFLSRFQHIIAVDPDPLAALIFTIRFRRTCSDIRTITRDFFVSSGCSAEPLHQFLAEHAKAAVLLSNFLGQLPFLTPDEKERRRVILFWQTHLIHLLDGRSWASFHDRYSSRERPLKKRLLQSNHQLSAQTLIRYFYGPEASGTFIDHQTSAYFPDMPFYEYNTWQLVPRRYHVIEAVFSRKASEEKRE